MTTIAPKLNSDFFKFRYLIRQAEKGSPGALIRLQHDYGLDLDYKPGFDDGEEPEIRNYEK